MASRARLAPKEARTSADAPAPESNAGTTGGKRAEMLNAPPPTTCCLCGAPFQGRRYLCPDCGEAGAVRADVALQRGRVQRAAEGKPVHGGGRFLDH